MSRPFTVLVFDLTTGVSRRESFSSPAELLGGSGLAAGLFERHCLPVHNPDDPLDPAHPVILAIGPLAGAFPTASKCAAAFVSPAHGGYAESHAGGRLALAMRFSNLDAVVVTGRAARLSALVIGARRADLQDCEYLRGKDVFETGQALRRAVKAESGRRSIARIGPAGELGLSYACVNVDTYRHFGRLGLGAAFGSKNLKALILLGDGSLPAPENSGYVPLHKEIHEELTTSGMLRKYHDLGTAENIWAMDKLGALPWRNLQATSDPEVERISGERFARRLLLRQTACAGCPVGCVHIGLLRETFGRENERLYRQVAYDYEPIFACGAMLGVTRAPDVLSLVDECSRLGMDVISAGVSLAWGCEAFQQGLISLDQTVEPLTFGDAAGLRRALKRLARGENDFFRLLGQGAKAAAREYGGTDFACVLGQEMAGYATGEAYVASQADSLRHSHLDEGAYLFDQTRRDAPPEEIARLLLGEERSRLVSNCLMTCLFARKAYTRERAARALEALGEPEAAANLEALLTRVQALRWRCKLATANPDARPNAAAIPKRLMSFITASGPVDPARVEAIRTARARLLEELLNRSE